MPLKELEEIEATEVGKLHMNAVVLSHLGLQGKPVSLKLLESLLGFFDWELLHKLVAAEHVPSNFRERPNLVVVCLHLFETGTIGVTHKVKSVTTGGPMPHNHIPFFVLENQMQIEVLFQTL